MTKETTYRLKVIDEPEAGTRSIFICDAPVATFMGTGPRSYQCGTCGKTLIQGARIERFANVVFKCGKCGGFNEIPTAHQAD
ncbi:MAG: hypothetical protein IIA05_00075 [Proteobacteria bacterium]|nr:hypothetical protein [Pseudomonadota bacterium]